MLWRRYARVVGEGEPAASETSRRREAVSRVSGVCLRRGFERALVASLSSCSELSFAV